MLLAHAEASCRREPVTRPRLCRRTPALQRPRLKDGTGADEVSGPEMWDGVRVGFVVAGLGWPQFAGLVVAGLALAFYLLDLIGSILRLSDDVMNLTLNRHLGKPMIGNYDTGGLVFCLAVAIGGLLVAALLYSRRDLKLP